MQSKSVHAETQRAAAPLESDRFIGYDGNYASATNPALGVTRASADTHDVVPVDVLGTAIVDTAEAISRGGAVAVGANGMAIQAGDNPVVARALHGAMPGSPLEVLLIPN